MAPADGDPAAQPAEASTSPAAWCGLYHGEAIVVCALCGRYIGGVLGQLAALPGAVPEAAESDGVACELGCGERYCDDACRSAAGVYHTKLCVGPHGEDHPLYKFKLAAFGSGAYSEFLLAAKIAVTTTLGAENGANSEEAASRAARIWEAAKHHAPWWELRGAGGSGPDGALDDGEFSEWSAEAEEAARTSWSLLSEGVGLGTSERTAEDWGRLLGYMVAEKVTLSRPSLLETFCRNTQDASDLSDVVANGLLALARATLQRRLMEAEAEAEQDDGDEVDENEDGEQQEQAEKEAEEAAEEEEEDEDAKEEEQEEDQEEDQDEEAEGEGEGQDEDAEEEEEEDEGLESLSSQRLLARLLADPGFFFPPFESALIYPRLRADHSCAPDYREELLPAVEPNDGSAGSICEMGMQLVACRPGISTAAGLPTAAGRTICRVDGNLPVAGRQLELGGKGLPACSCERCRFESGQVDELDDSTLETLLEVAKQAGRHGEALALLEEQARRHGPETAKGAEALYWRSVVTGWDDRWGEAHRLLAEGARLAPTDDKLRSTLAASLSYTGWSPESKCDPSSSEEEEEDSPVNSIGKAVDGLDGRAFVAPALLDASDCVKMVASVEDTLQGNWTTSRHYAVPTTDVQVHTLPTVGRWFNRMLEFRIFPALGAQFAVDPTTLRIIDSFVVRYDAAKQRSLPLHCDQSQFSLTVALNTLDEYQGGGTFFAQTGEAVNCDIGGVISFEGGLLHSGHPITKGTRYILVCFIYSDAGDEDEGDEKGEGGGTMDLAAGGGSKRKLDEVSP